MEIEKIAQRGSLWHCVVSQLSAALTFYFLDWRLTDRNDLALKFLLHCGLTAGGSTESPRSALQLQKINSGCPILELLFSHSRLFYKNGATISGQ